jgi:6-pyruvoyl tetrahydropterin synthase/QueD family protein
MPPYLNPHRAVRVERQRLKFAAAHMATFGTSIEPLHGHNYAVMIEVEGDLSDIGWVVDFGILKRLGRELCDRLDHHFLLQRDSTLLEITRTATEIAVIFGEKRYSFPAADVFLLPIPNTTAELIAEWLWGELAGSLAAAAVTTVHRLTLGVEEAPGQAGWFGADLPPAG